MTTRETDAEYVVGRTALETERLQKQGELLAPSLRSLFQWAGLAVGMRVLDVGSGSGDVALLAGELVGPTGSVVGVDGNASILDTARARAQRAGMNHLSFVAGDIRSVALDGPFDAVVGRNVLMYNADPAVILRAVASRVTSGGIIAFHELDFDISNAIIAIEGVPPRYTQLFQWLTEGFRHAGAHLRMGFALPTAFVAAGLPLPQMHIDGIVGTGQDWAGYSLLRDTLVVMMPRLVEYGVLREGEIDPDAYIAALRAEVSKQPCFIPMYVQVGAWVRTP